MQVAGGPAGPQPVHPHIRVVGPVVPVITQQRMAIPTQPTIRFQAQPQLPPIQHPPPQYTVQSGNLHGNQMQLPPQHHLLHHPPSAAAPSQPVPPVVIQSVQPSAAPPSVQANVHVPQQPIVGHAQQMMPPPPPPTTYAGPYLSQSEGYVIFMLSTTASYYTLKLTV